MDSGTSVSLIESFILQCPLQKSSKVSMHAAPVVMLKMSMYEFTNSNNLQCQAKQDLDNYIHMYVYGPGKMAQLCSSCCSFGALEPSSHHLSPAAHKFLQLQHSEVLSLPASKGTNTRVSYICGH